MNRTTNRTNLLLIFTNINRATYRTNLLLTLKNINQATYKTNLLLSGLTIFQWFFKKLNETLLLLKYFRWEHHYRRKRTKVGIGATWREMLNKVGLNNDNLVGRTSLPDLTVAGWTRLTAVFCRNFTKRK